MRLRSLFAALGFLMAFAAPSQATETSVTVLWFAPSDRVYHGAVMIQNGEVMEGMQVLGEALEGKLEFGDVALAHTNMCAGYLALKLYRDAIKSCNIALSIRPHMWEALNNRAAAYHMLGDFDAAIASYQQALVLSPLDKTLVFNLTLAQRHKRTGAPPPGVERDG